MSQSIYNNNNNNNSNNDSRSNNSKNAYRGNDNERHYCAACNAWMGGDRQSISIHEQGRKHRERVEEALAEKREGRARQARDALSLRAALARMNREAVASHLTHDAVRYCCGTAAELHRGDDSTSSSVLHASAGPPPGAAPPSARPGSSTTRRKTADDPPKQHNDVRKDAKTERAAWESRKKKREDEQSKNKDSDDSEEDESQEKKAKRQLDPDEGNYAVGDKTYLEGVTFIDIVEEDMPVEVWMGSHLASLAEKRLPEKQHHWRSGLIIKVRRSSQEKETGRVLDVAYLKDPGDEDETIEKSVPPNRIRMILGADPSIPDTLEEARIAATGSQVVVVVQPDGAAEAADEATGLSGWGTVEIRKTTARQEQKEERERARRKRREEARRKEEELRRAQGIRMEEARADNAEDSALGAYDVWNAGRAGYKGVDINTTEKMTAADAAGISLSGGKKVEFKKKAAFKKGKKQNRRTTSADDL